jgi:hypothetical protein
MLSNLKIVFFQWIGDEFVLKDEPQEYVESAEGAVVGMPQNIPPEISKEVSGYWLGHLLVRLCAAFNQDLRRFK